MRAASLIAWTLLVLSPAAVPKEPATAAAKDDAAAFGAIEEAWSADLSADGTHIVLVGQADGPSTHAVVIDVAKGSVQQVARANNDPMRLTSCGWTAADRLLCTLYGLDRPRGVLLSLSGLMAMDADGGHQLRITQRNTIDQIGYRQYDGRIVDWLNGVDGDVLVARDSIPEASTGALTARSGEGMEVVRINTRTGKATPVERPGASTRGYVSDGQGNVRLMLTMGRRESGQLRGILTTSYRSKDDRMWKELGTYDEVAQEGMLPLAVDPLIDAAYVQKKLNGRWAVYRIALDGSMKTELVLASKEVDVDDVVQVGRSGRVIGVTYVTDRPHVEYFDPTYRSIALSLAKALPKLPLISFESASADEQTLLVRAASDVDPGHFYLFDRAKHTLGEVLPVRPDLKGRTLSAVRAVTYPAADGTEVPAYLTLPPGVTDAKGLPAIVMPHGGPAARDTWGFDWLVQFFAQRGYAVLQPNFRGSSGYGDNWFVNNGYQSWKIAIGDVCDAGRWLVNSGMADPSKLAIFGWSYGGYAALQANVLDPDLFKAVVAVAPVTDLALKKAEAQTYDNADIVDKYVGSGPHVTEGSPAQNAARFKAPVLMFHGDTDLNVDIDQSRKMDKELKAAGKSTQLIVYPGLDHSLPDGTVRADMLRKSDAFLRAKLGM